MASMAFFMRDTVEEAFSRSGTNCYKQQNKAVSIKGETESVVGKSKTHVSFI